MCSFCVVYIGSPFIWVILTHFSMIPRGLIGIHLDLFHSALNVILGVSRELVNFCRSCLEGLSFCFRFFVFFFMFIFTARFLTFNLFQVIISR